MKKLPQDFSKQQEVYNEKTLLSAFYSDFLLQEMLQLSKN